MVIGAKPSTGVDDTLLHHGIPSLPFTALTIATLPKKFVLLKKYVPTLGILNVGLARLFEKGFSLSIKSTSGTLATTIP